MCLDIHIGALKSLGPSKFIYLFVPLAQRWHWIGKRRHGRWTNILTPPPACVCIKKGCLQASSGPFQVLKRSEFGVTSISCGIRIELAESYLLTEDWDWPFGVRLTLISSSFASSCDWCLFRSISCHLQTHPEDIVAYSGGAGLGVGR